jgi:hypothetical protein
MGRVKAAIMEAIEKSETLEEACDLLDAWGMHGYEPDDEMMVEMWKCMVPDLHRCDNCEDELEEEQLDQKWPDIDDIGQRLDPGGTVPSGTCPKCGALCYPKE